MWAHGQCWNPFFQRLEMRRWLWGTARYGGGISKALSGTSPDLSMKMINWKCFQLNYPSRSMGLGQVIKSKICLDNSRKPPIDLLVWEIQWLIDQWVSEHFGKPPNRPHISPEDNPTVPRYAVLHAVENNHIQRYFQPSRYEQGNQPAVLDDIWWYPWISVKWWACWIIHASKSVEWWLWAGKAPIWDL